VKTSVINRGLVGALIAPLIIVALVLIFSPVRSVEAQEPETSAEATLEPTAEETPLAVEVLTGTDEPTNGGTVIIVNPPDESSEDETQSEIDLLRQQVADLQAENAQLTERLSSYQSLSGIAGLVFGAVIVIIGGLIVYINNLRSNVTLMKLFESAYGASPGDVRLLVEKLRDFFTSTGGFLTDVTDDIPTGQSGASTAPGAQSANKTAWLYSQGVPPTLPPGSGPIEG
jgi:hypothetical protein